MMVFLEDLWKSYQKLDKIKDENVGQWGFLGSILFPISVPVAYLVFVFVVGPKLMKNRPPLRFYHVMLCYNIFQVVFNIYLWTQVSWYLSLHVQSLQCIEIEKPESKIFNQIRNIMWLVTINKSLDLLDTIFFVLRKKQSHITFLHVYHHLLTFGGAWYLARYAPGGLIAVFGFLNTFVHVLMYTYYFCAVCESLKPYAICFKKQTTQLQLIQFSIAGLHGFYALADDSCSYPKYLICFGLLQNTLMIFLFSKFYVKTYMNNKKQMDIDIL